MIPGHDFLLIELRLGVAICQAKSPHGREIVSVLRWPSAIDEESDLEPTQALSCWQLSGDRKYMERMEGA